MKKILLFGCLLIASLFSTVYAGGGITHMFIAQEVIEKLPDAQLRNLLKDNLDAYLVGAVYPDSGYIDGAHYGEDSHWDPFIYTFADYLKEKYANPALENPKLVAFLFGCAVHRVSDEITHWTFYHVMQEKDFKGNGNEAHTYGDIGIDLLLNIDKSQWFKEPTSWWVPVSDLVAIYHKMGKDQYTAKEIIWGNSVLSAAGFGERIIAAPGYPILKWKMPWTAGHYYDWPEGGILMDEQKVAEYQINLWQRLQSKGLVLAGYAKKPQNTLRIGEENNVSEVPLKDFAQTALNSGIVSVAITNNEDGSVNLEHPSVEHSFKFRSLIAHLITKLSS